MWLSQLPGIERRLEVLREEHLRVKRSGKLADASATYTIGEVSTLCQLPQYKIRGLEQHRLISPARSEGGQRRYTHGDVSRIKHYAEALNSGKSYEELLKVAVLNLLGDSAEAGMSVSGSMSGPRQTGPGQLSALQVPDWTMRTVAELYLDACEKFPRRDQSVIEYIRSRMPWLTTSYVITLIRRARRKGIELPIYRRGRIPKRTGVAQRMALLQQDKEPK
jgi:MerR family transcriptional regulator/heat shock protein HspR